MNTPTPRTDEQLVLQKYTIPWQDVVDVNFAATLERELTAAREEIKELNDKLDDAVADATNAVNDIIRMKWQRDRLAEELTTTRQAHDVVVLAFRKVDAELTAVTEQRDGLAEELKETKKHLKDANRGAEINAHALRINADKLAAVTEQRDRLAEALEKAKAVYTPSSKGEYQTGWHDAICWVNQQALQSLNQNAHAQTPPDSGTKDHE